MDIKIISLHVKLCSYVHRLFTQATMVTLRLPLRSILPRPTWLADSQNINCNVRVSHGWLDNAKAGDAKQE
jgi:hypothetical protein